MNRKLGFAILMYTFILFLIFLYLFFPKDMVKAKLEYVLAHRFPGRVLIHDLSFLPPAQVRINGLELSLPNNAQQEKTPSMSIREIMAGPDFLKIFRGKVGFKGEALIGEGTIKIAADQGILGSRMRHLSGSLDKIAIQDIPVLSQQFGIHVTGLARGELTAEWPANDMLKSAGNWSFTIEKGKITPRQFPAFTYDSASGSGVIKEQTIQINRIEIQGQDLSLIAAGNVRLAPAIQRFFIDTQVGLKVLPRLRQRLGGFADLLPKPDSDGFINLFVSGPPSELRFSSEKRRL